MISLTLNSEQLDNLHKDILLSLLDLRDRSNDNFGVNDGSYIAHWTESIEQIEYDLPCYILQVGLRAVMWSCFDGAAGVDDISVVDAEDDLSAQLQEYADGIAMSLE